MPRLLLMTIDFPPRTGGVARYLVSLANYFREDIVVVAQREMGDKESDRHSSFPIERKSVLSMLVWPRWSAAVRIMIRKRATYDTVMTSHVLPIGTAAMVAKWFTGKSYIVIVHGLDVALAKRDFLKRKIATRVLRGAKFVVTNSEALKREVMSDFGLEKVVVVYPPAHPATALHRTFHKNEVRLLTVSRLVERKGHLRVLEAISRLKKRGELDAIQYTIVGDGPMKEEIAGAIKRLGLQSIVEMKHQVSDEGLDEVYACADIFVMPTSVVNDVDREGFGTVYLEAAAHGIPSIASNLPGPNEAVLDRETGLLVQDGDIDALAAAIKKLAIDQDVRERLGAAAKVRMQTEFSPAVQWKKLEELL